MSGRPTLPHAAPSVNEVFSKLIRCERASYSPSHLAQLLLVNEVFSKHYDCGVPCMQAERVRCERFMPADSVLTFVS